MSVDLLGGPGAALITDKSPDHAQDPKPGELTGEAGALFASLLAAIAAPAAPSGVAAATPALTGESGEGSLPAPADTASGKTSCNPVVVLPGLRLPIMLQELPVEGGAEPQPQVGKGSNPGAGLGEALNLAIMARTGTGSQLLMPRGQQAAPGSTATAATLMGATADANGAEIATANSPQETTARPPRPVVAAQASATPTASNSDQQSLPRLATVVADEPALAEVKPSTESAADSASATPSQTTTKAQTTAVAPTTTEAQTTAVAPTTTEAPTTAHSAPVEAAAPHALTAVAMDRLQAVAGNALVRPHADGTARSSVDPTRIQAQVTRALLANGGPRGGDQTLTLQLEPEHLGKVEVRLIARGNRLEVTFTAETAEAQVALRESNGDLVRTLSSRIDGRWQHIDVKVSDPADPRRDSTQQDSRNQERSRDGRRDPDQQERRRERRQNQ